LQANVKIRLENVVTEMGGESSSKTIETTLGRALFNETLPANYPFVNEEVKK